MSKKLGEVINNIMEENSSRRVLFITNHMYIIGTVHDYYDKCDNCHECLIALKNVKMAKIDELCNCGVNGCECNLHVFSEFDWFNISAHSIVGFSVLAEE